MTPPGHHPVMFCQMINGVIGSHYYKEATMNMDHTLRAMDESRLDQLRRLERLFTDLNHQRTEKRFEDYSGTATRRKGCGLYEINNDLIPLLHARSIVDVGKAESTQPVCDMCGEHDGADSEPT